jgi:hypothetical protein
VIRIFFTAVSLCFLGFLACVHYIHAATAPQGSCGIVCDTTA